MTIQRISDHVEQAKSLLIDQYKGRPRMEAVLSSITRQAQLLDDATYEVFWRRTIDFAEAAQLDTIGKIVGENRQGDPDGIYRTFIRARIRVNRSKGTMPDILGVLSIIVPTTPADVSEVRGMNILLTLFAETSRPRRLFRMLHDTRAGAVGFSMVSAASSLDRGLTFSSVGDPVMPGDAARSFGDTAGSFLSGLAAEVVTG